jgi:integrase
VSWSTPRRPPHGARIPLRAEVADALEAWRHRQQQRAADGFDNGHDLVFTTRSGHPVDQRNVSRAFHRARTTAGVDHGSLKTFRSTVATQLAEAGFRPSKTQAFLGHAHVTTTMTYYTAVDNLDEAAALLPALTKSWSTLSSHAPRWWYLLESPRPLIPEGQTSIEAASMLMSRCVAIGW